MKSKTKLTILITSILLLLLVGFVYFLKGTASTSKTVTIVDRGFSICTLDVPSSNCGSYDVTVRTTGGQKITYKVAGFSNRDSELYDELTSKITRAKERKTQVTIAVNKYAEIISVR
jgi:hypothetical protein